LEEAEQYNDLCYRLKALCDPSNPQSQRLDFWKLMVKENITLLTSEESSDVQHVSKEDSQQFLSETKTQASQKSMHEATMAEPEDDFSADNLVSSSIITKVTRIHDILTEFCIPSLICLNKP
jgi:hypothetical protein